MKVNNLIKDAENSFLYMERYVNDGSPSGFSTKTTSENTAPKSEVKSFKVSIIQFDDTIEVIDIGEDRGYMLPNRAIFCHPDNLSQPFLQKILNHWNEIGTVEVSPTASGRTVKCVGDRSHFIKLDYFGILGRIQRNLDKKKLLSAFEVSSEIKDAIDKDKVNNFFQFFREDYGRVAILPLSEGGTYELGFLIRDDKPYPTKDRLIAYIPFFSLFGKDAMSPNDEPIVVQLFKKQNKVSTDFLADDILIPVVNCYFDTLSQCGMCLEAHAQNMLLGIDADFHVISIISRDMESVDKDLPLRKHLNLPNFFESAPYKCLNETDYNYHIMHSFMFDFKLGVYLIDPLINVFENIEGFDKERVINRIRDVVAERSKELTSDYFPMQWYNYGNEIFKRGEKRPYIAHYNPRYR